MAKKVKKKRSEFSQLPKKNRAGNFPAEQLKVGQVKIAPTMSAMDTQEPSVPALQELFANGQRDAFLNMLSRLSLNDPANAPHLPELGNMLMRAKDFDTAATIFRAWSEADPTSAKAFNSLGTALVSGNWLDAGQNAFLQAVALEPKQSVYQLNLAKLYMVRDMWEQAKSMLMSLMHNHPETQAKVAELLEQFPEEQSMPQNGGNYGVVQNVRPMGAPGVEKLPLATPGKIFLCCVEGLDNFVDDIIAGLAPQITIEKQASNNWEQLLNSISGYDTIWLEWGDEQAVRLSNQQAGLLQDKRVILRIHSYEVFDGFAENINFEVVDDLIFVAPHIKDVCLRLAPKITQQVKRIHVVPNGIDMSRFTLPANKQANKNMAFVGYLNFKKDSMVLAHSFYYLSQMAPDFRLHIAGNFQDLRTRLAFPHFISINQLQEKIILHGWQEDMAAWLQDKTYIILSSLMEGHPVGVLEAMACGLQPLVYNFPGAEGIYPSEFLWNNAMELSRMVRIKPQFARYRGFVEQNYSLDIQLERLRKIIIDKVQVVEPATLVW